jgi:hypothetical protein
LGYTSVAEFLGHTNKEYGVFVYRLGDLKIQVFGLLGRVHWLVVTDVSKDYSAFIFRVK